MAERSYPFVDGLTTDAEFSAMFDVLQGSGVVEATGLLVTAASTGLNVRVAKGSAFVRGHFYSNTASKTLSIDPGDASPRIDAVVARLEYGTVKSISAQVIKGTPAANPVAPTLEATTDNKYDLLLGYVNVPANAATITASNVTDARLFASKRVEVWPTSRRPAGERGQIGYNTSTSRLQYFDTAWRDISSNDDVVAALTTRIEALEARPRLYVSLTEPANAPENAVWVTPVS